MKNIVIFGVSDAAQLAHYYFTRDSGLQVEAFSVDPQFVPKDARFCGLPVIPFDELTSAYPPDLYDCFVALGYSKLNQVRREKYLVAKSMGYRMVNYISSKATVLNDGEFGDNCFILEDNTIQPFARIGNNVTLWSGNHIGHHTTIGDHCFLASQVVISGHVRIGESCFIGVNATFRDHITVGEQCIIGAGALMLSDAASGGVYIGAATERSKAPSNRVRHI